MKPNILLITLDAVRPDRLRLYGGPVEMPNLEALAAQGVTFTNAWAQAPNTWTSHASVFTGLWPHHHGLLDMDCTLDPGVPTMAEIFRDAGYATAGWPGCVAAGSKFGLDRGFGIFHEKYLYGLGEWGAGFVDFEQNIKAFAAFKRAAEYDDGVKSFPWLAWLHYFDVHHMPDEVWEKRMPSVELWRKYYGFPEEMGDGPGVQFYDAKVAHADHYIGEILKHVDLDNTIVVVFSDHGEDLSLESLPWPCHGGLSDEELKVVLVVSLPHRIVCDHKEDKRVRLIDIAPTLIRRRGVWEFPDPCEGTVEHMDGRDVFDDDLVPRMNIATNGKDTRVDGNRNVREKESDKVKKQLAGLGYVEGE